MNIELDNENYLKILEHDVHYHDTYDLWYVDLWYVKSETLNERVKLWNGEFKDMYRRTRYVFQVKDKQKFMLLVIATSIEYRIFEHEKDQDDPSR